MRTKSAIFRLAIVVLLLSVPASGQGPAAQEFRVQAGDEGSFLWIEIPDGGDGFDLGADPGRPGGCLLSLPGLHLSAAEVAASLAELPSVGVEPSADGTGTTLFLPVRPGSLSSAKRLEGGWRLTFSHATAAGPAGGDYRLGTRDRIAVTVFGHADLTREETVPPGGIITFPLIGEVQAAGRTVAEVEQELERRLSADFLVNPQVNVRVKEYESQWVNVMGQVRTAGKQPIKGRSTLIDVLTAAGGLTDTAGSEIVVSRPLAGGGQVRVNRDDLFSVNNESFNLVLSHGDVVNVLEQEVFYIQGEVIKPGIYPLERGYTLLKAISVAGGFSQWADRKEVELLRAQEGDQKKIVINLKAISERKKQDVDLQAEDIIIVRRRLL